MTYEPLSPDTTVLLLVDHQTRVLEWVVKAPPREEVEGNLLRLTRAAAMLEMPLIFSTSEEKENGMLLPAVEELHPDAYAARIERHGVIDSLADPAVAEALTATGRRRLITAGIGTEVCGIPAALHAHNDGYDVTFIADASGSPTALGQDVALRRLEREGVSVATTAMVLAELAGDYPAYAKIMRA
jgi:nicotinamidase-related amidase